MESNLTSFKDWEVWNMYTKFEEEIKHLVPVFDDQMSKERENL